MLEWILQVQPRSQHLIYCCSRATQPAQSSRAAQPAQSSRAAQPAQSSRAAQPAQRLSLVKKKKAQQQNMRPLTIVRWANKPRNGNKSWLTTSGMLIVVNTSSSEPWDMFASNTYSLCWRKRSVAPALMSSTSVLLRISLYT